jgi:hypothetical protein
VLVPGGFLGVVPQLHHLTCVAEGGEQGGDASGVVVPASSVHVGPVVEDHGGLPLPVEGVENVLVGGSARHLGLVWFGLVWFGLVCQKVLVCCLCLEKLLCVKES